MILPKRLSFFSGLFALVVSSPSVLSGQSAVADTIRGLAFDSLAWQPLAGAMITAEPGGESAVSDAEGRFEIISSQIVQRLVGFHDRADELGFGNLMATRPEGAARWERPIIAIPGIASVWERLCAPARRPGGVNGGVVFGSVIASDGKTRVGGVGLELQWESVLSSVAGSSRKLESVTTRSDSLGNYVFCGVQDFGPAAIVATSSTWKSGNVLLNGSSSSVRRRDLIVGPTEGEGAFAVVGGRIVDQDGEIVRDANVTIDGFAGEIASGPNGRFTLQKVPTGSRMLSVRRVGYLNASVQLDLTSKGVTNLVIPMEKTTLLETIETRRERVLNRDATELEERKATLGQRFMDSTYFNRFSSTQQAFATAPGVHTAVGRAPSDFLLLGRGDCLMTVWVNGVKEPNDFDSMLTRMGKDAIAAVELYPSDRLAPVRFQTPGNTCGVAVVWTKMHINAPPPKR